ncbi:prepilin peptidase [Polymorphobacter sp.]|uniref:prepilin peptidase n=1 Tax=Polymorphobacter sp. TaxID=1909290 RepID=UPI003F710625
MILGSFIAALTWRWPRGESIAHGRSRCDSCDATLGAAELVPVLSFVLGKGRCRHCDAPIPRRHLAIELAAAAMVFLALLVAPGLAGVALAGFGLALLTLAILDVEHFWLPDRLTLPLIAAGLGLGAWMPPSLAERLIGTVAGFACLALIAIAYRLVRGREGLGGGDAKLLAAIGAWLGWVPLPFVLLGASLLGLVLALLARLRGRSVVADTALPLGALLAAAAWPLALLQFAS